MSEKPMLLIELGCEEMPARLLESQASGLFDGLARRLSEAGLEFERAASGWLATPRRLTARFAGMAEGQPDQVLERLGPPVKTAFDENGQPTRAAEGFARSVGRAIEDLEHRDTEQGQRLYARVEKPGQSLEELLPDMLHATLSELAGARSMRWSQTGERFLRPLRWLVVLHGDKVLPIETYGLQAGRKSRGHRIHAPGPLNLSRADEYESALEDAFVLADPAIRRDRIRAQVEALAAEAGLQANADPGLLDEVANLVEWPASLLCDFDEGFLDVPQEALVSSMQQHQKFFPLFDADGRLANRFVAVANLESREPEAVRAGFQRVIRPRLADARFFRDQDRRKPLADYREGLARVVYQEKLGTLADKSNRVEVLATALAERLNADSSTRNATARAAQLYKCDLLTEMVGEFPELQGTMGRYYAAESGEPEAVATAIESHYRPRFASDDLPDDLPGQILGLAERLDTVIGVFAAGKKPKGSKDPFALRRSALGIVRLLVECRLELDFGELVHSLAPEAFRQARTDLSFSPELLDEVQSFVLERLRAWARENGIETNTFHATAAGRLTTLADFMDRARAVQEFSRLEAASSLVAANKRISNLLKKSDRNTFDEVIEKRLHENAEKQLFNDIEKAENALVPLRESADYPGILRILASLKEPVDVFFDQVMVMADDEGLRINRLALLARLRGLVGDVADMALLGR